MNRKTFIIWSSIAFAYSAIMVSAYYDGFFAFHDLGLLGQILTSYSLGFTHFAIPDTSYTILHPGQSHLAVHFTPTLMLLSPFLIVTGSNLSFLLLQAAALLFGFYFLAKIAETWRIPQSARSPVVLYFAALFSVGLYARTILMAAHFEVFYFLFASILMLSLVRNWNVFWVVLLTMLTLGVRQDTGLYLFFQLLILFFIENLRRGGEPSRSLYFYLMTVSITYTALVSIMMPQWFGRPMVDPISVHWSYLGSTWPEVFWSMITRPLTVLSQLRNSAALSLCLSFGIVFLWRPVLTILALVPATLILISEESTKREMQYYNSSFVMVGLVLVALFAISQSLENKWRMRFIAFGALVAVAHNFGRVATGTTQFKIYTKMRAVDAARSVAMIENLCPKIGSWSAGFKGSVFLPLNKLSYSAHQHREADAVLVWKDDSLYTKDGVRPLPLDFFDRSGHVSMPGSSKDVEVLVKKEIAESCQLQN